MALSVIITTAAGREANLIACLQQLTQQTYQDFEVLVCDDGSPQGQDLLKAAVWPYPLRYLWRANDLCPARSRNLGAQAAQYENLVLIDSDILLNPQALDAYQTLLTREPQVLWGGYFGYIPAYSAPSLFQPQRQVNYLDRRYALYSRQMIQPSPELQLTPGKLFWSGNIGLTRTVYRALGGFDEHFIGWGGEDNDFAFRALAAGYEVHFTLDTWAEHQVHPYQESFHQAYHQPQSSGQVFQQRPHPPVTYAVRVEGNPAIAQGLCRAILNHYAGGDTGVSDFFKQQFQHPQAVMVIKGDAGDRWDMAYLLPKD